MYEPYPEEDKIDLLHYWRVLFKRKWLIAACVGCCLFFAGIYSFKATPKYKATSSMWIEEDSSKTLNIEDEFGNRANMPNLFFFNTQIRLLQSKSLVERTARKLKLLDHPLFKPKPKSKNNENPATSDPNPYFKITEDLQKGVAISPVRQTRLVEIGYTSADPELAAQLVNSLAEEFLDFSMEKRLGTTEQASKFLSEQIEELRKNLALKDEELQKYGQGKDLFFLNDEESATISNFSDLSQALTQAQIQRVQSGATVQELRSVSVDSPPPIPGQPGDPGS